MACYVSKYLAVTHKIDTSKPDYSYRNTRVVKLGIYIRLMSERQMGLGDLFLCLNLGTPSCRVTYK